MPGPTGPRSVRRPSWATCCATRWASAVSWSPMPWTWPRSTRRMSRARRWPPSERVSTCCSRALPRPTGRSELARLVTALRDVAGGRGRGRPCRGAAAMAGAEHHAAPVGRGLRRARDARQASWRAARSPRSGTTPACCRCAPPARRGCWCSAPTPTDLTPADTSSTVVRSLLDAVRRRHARTETFTVSIDPSRRRRSRPPGSAVAAADLVILGTIDAFRHAGQQELARVIEQQGRPIVLVALRMPSDADLLDDLPTALACYSIHGPSTDAVAAVDLR